jgi:hypothetical protein
MQRTAEEFVHQLADGRWFVGDFLRTGGRAGEVYLIELRREGGVVELPVAVISTLSHSPGPRWVPTYAQKSSAKRAAQRMIERVLGEDES